MANTESKTSQFIEITGLTKTEAVQFLEATDWVVDEALQLFFTVGRDGLRDALPPQNPGRSFASDYNAYLRESAYRAIYRDHLRQSALRAGVGPETSPRTRRVEKDRVCIPPYTGRRGLIQHWQLGTFS